MKYEDALGEKNVFSLSATDIKTKKQSNVDVFVGSEFPRRVDLISELGSLSCFQN